jgi:hypothetical protein
MENAAFVIFAASAFFIGVGFDTRMEQYVGLVYLGLVALAFFAGKMIDAHRAKGINALGTTALTLQALQQQINAQRLELDNLKTEIREQRHRTHTWADFANDKVLRCVMLMHEVNVRDEMMAHAPTYDIQKEIDNERTLLKLLIDNLHEFVDPERKS